MQPRNAITFTFGVSILSFRLQVYQYLLANDLSVSRFSFLIGYIEAQIAQILIKMKKTIILIMAVFMFTAISCKKENIKIDDPNIPKDTTAVLNTYIGNYTGYHTINSTLLSNYSDSKNDAITVSTISSTKDMRVYSQFLQKQYIAEFDTFTQSINTFRIKNFSANDYNMPNGDKMINCNADGQITFTTNQAEQIIYLRGTLVSTTSPLNGFQVSVRFIGVFTK
jgi:hypothetical protein